MRKKLKSDNLKTNGFRGLLGTEIPPELLEAQKRRDAAEKAVNSMELPAELRRAMELILELHLADRELTYRVLEELTEPL